MFTRDLKQQKECLWHNFEKKKDRAQYGICKMVSARQTHTRGVLWPRKMSGRRCPQIWPGSSDEWLSFYSISYLFGFFLNPYLRMYLLILEREEERERERKKHQSVASCLRPDWGSNPQPVCAPWPETEPTTFWRMGQRSNQLSHPARAILFFKFCLVLCLLYIEILIFLAFHFTF